MSDVQTGYSMVPNEYEVFEADSPVTLMVRVNNAMAEGWMVSGGVAVANLRVGGPVCLQAMVRYNYQIYNVFGRCKL